LAAGARVWQEMDSEQKETWLWLGKQASQQYEQAKTRRDEKNALLSNIEKKAARPAKPTTEAGAVSKSKVKPSARLFITC